jgi:hypothetical protein
VNLLPALNALIGKSEWRHGFPLAELGGSHPARTAHLSLNEMNAGNMIISGGKLRP